MFTIEGHAAYRANTPNGVALHIAGDVFANQPHGTFGATAVAAEVAELKPGESATFHRIAWQGAADSRAASVIVTRTA